MWQHGFKVISSGFTLGLFFFILLISQGVQSGTAESIGIPQPKPNREKATPPAPPKLKEPSAFQSVTATEITFRWEPSSNASEYHLQVAKDPQFKWLVYENKHISNTEHVVKNLPSGSLFWRVFATSPYNDPGQWKSIANYSSFQLNSP